MQRSPFTVEFPHADSSVWLFSCKEMFDIPGFPATCGHPRYAPSRESASCSPVIRSLQLAGATLRGKTRQSELAISALGCNRHETPPVNALDPQLVPGGSSSGCAVAVARGLVSFSVATDTAGSARIPAACNGVTGLSLANSSRFLAGAVQLAPSLDQLGLLARDAQALQRVLTALNLAPQPRLPENLFVPIDLLRQHCSEQVLVQFRKAVTRLRADGWSITETTSEAFTVFDDLQNDYGSLAMAEISSSLNAFIQKDRAQVEPELLQRLEPYLQWPASRLNQLRKEVVYARIPASDAAWLLPTLPCAIPRVDSQLPAPPLGSLTKYANLMAMNSISIPFEPGYSIMLQAADLGTVIGFALQVGTSRSS